MTTPTQNASGAAPAGVPTPLWSVQLQPGVGMLAISPDDGCIVSSPGVLAAYTSAGKLLWETAVVGHPAKDYPIVTKDGSLLRFEDDALVTRSLHSGQITSSFAAPLGSLLSLTPWGDLVFTQPAASGTAAVRCVTRSGAPCWSISLERPAPLFTRPIGIGDVVVIERRGALWAVDRAGHWAWVADRNGLRTPSAEDENEPSAANSGDSVRDAALRIDDQRVVVCLEGHHGSGLYMLDARVPSITALAVPCPAQPPFQVLPHETTQYRFVGLGPQIDLGQMNYRFPVVCIEPGGRQLWSHPLEAKAIALRVAPQGALIATANPTAKRWRDYSAYYDLARETFVCCIPADGSERWIVHSKTPWTHLPVVSAGGTVYVASNQQLLAFATV
jgi:hypothetical protein